MTGRINTREAACEVSCRIALLREKNKRRLRRAQMATGALCFALLVWATALPGIRQAGDTWAVQGSALELAADAAGGYVLVGIICFVLGVFFTLVCLRVRGKRRK